MTIKAYNKAPSEKFSKKYVTYSPLNYSNLIIVQVSGWHRKTFIHNSVSQTDVHLVLYMHWAFCVYNMLT